MKYQDGFSAPELLITLFIGAAFIGAAYQLYGIIIRDSASSRQQAMASDLANQTLRQKMNDGTLVLATCKASSTTPSIANPGLPTPFSVAVKVDCPYGTSGQSAAISRVTVTVNYGSNGVTHAAYAAQN